MLSIPGSIAMHWLGVVIACCYKHTCIDHISETATSAEVWFGNTILSLTVYLVQYSMQATIKPRSILRFENQRSRWYISLKYLERTIALIERLSRHQKQKHQPSVPVLTLTFRLLLREFGFFLNSHNLIKCSCLGSKLKQVILCSWVTILFVPARDVRGASNGHRNEG